MPKRSGGSGQVSHEMRVDRIHEPSTCNRKDFNFGRCVFGSTAAMPTTGFEPTLRAKLATDRAGYPLRQTLFSPSEQGPPRPGDQDRGGRRHRSSEPRRTLDNQLSVLEAGGATLSAIMSSTCGFDPAAMSPTSPLQRSVSGPASATIVSTRTSSWQCAFASQQCQHRQIDCVAMFD